MVRSIPVSAAWNAFSVYCSLPAICSSVFDVLMPDIASNVRMSSRIIPTHQSRPALPGAEGVVPSASVSVHVCVFRIWMVRDTSRRRKLSLGVKSTFGVLEVRVVGVPDFGSVSAHADPDADRAHHGFAIGGIPVYQHISRAHIASCEHRCRSRVGRCRRDHQARRHRRDPLLCRGRTALACPRCPA